MIKFNQTLQKSFAHSEFAKSTKNQRLCNAYILLYWYLIWGFSLTSIQSNILYLSNQLANSFQTILK